ncbi:MAG: thioredoxin family protein [Thermonemataceae bacterium]|nr:thioredoxin family protein [Thermonemataceae bacterium]
MLLDATDATFQQELSQHEKVIVKYFASWCGSCKLFAPKYKRLSNDERFSGVAFLDINAEENPEARKTAGVNNLPSFAIFLNGKHLETISTNKEEAVVELLTKLQA